MNLVEDAEDLVGIDRAQRQIVVGIAPVVEVESAQHPGMQQPRHNLLDILRVVVVAGIHQHARLRPRLPRQVACHAPIGNIGVIERRLKRLVLHQQTLRGARWLCAMRSASSSQPIRLRMLCVPG
jgi:hypothetical protein